MSSTNKSSMLNLNQWIGSDVPCRADFNYDNNVIDSVLGKHLNDISLHTSINEKNVWNNPYFITTYFGNGAASRTITLNCGFEPLWGIVFASSVTPSVVDIQNGANYNYFGIASTSGSSAGLGITGNQLKLTQSPVPVAGTEFRSYNENGVTYVTILFR